MCPRRAYPLRCNGSSLFLPPLEAPISIPSNPARSGQMTRSASLSAENEATRWTASSCASQDNWGHGTGGCSKRFCSEPFQRQPCPIAPWPAHRRP